MEKYIMGYNEATDLFASLRRVKRYVRYFNPMKCDLIQFEKDLDLMINDIILYRQYIKKDFKKKNGL